MYRQVRDACICEPSRHTNARILTQYHTQTPRHTHTHTQSHTCTFSLLHLEKKNTYTHKGVCSSHLQPMSQEENTHKHTQTCTFFAPPISPERPTHARTQVCISRAPASSKPGKYFLRRASRWAHFWVGNWSWLCSTVSRLSASETRNAPTSQCLL